MKHTSRAFPVVAVGSLFTYLISIGSPPTVWPYVEWLKLGAFVAGLAAAQLGSSPLPGDEK